MKRIRPPETLNVKKTADENDENAVQEIAESLLETSMNTKYEADLPTLPVLSSSIYRVKILVGNKSEESMNVLEAAFDTCASAYIIRRDILPPDVEIQSCENLPRLVDANGGRLKFDGVATVTIRIGCMKLSIDFLVAREFSVPLILGTSFIDENVSVIFPDQNRIVLKDLSEVAIIHSSVETSSVKIIRDYMIPSFSEFFVGVTTKRAGLSEIRPATLRSRKIHAANGVLEIPSSRSFKIIIANFSEDAIFLRSGTVVAYATELQAVVIMKREKSENTDNWRNEVDLDENIPKDIHESAMKILESHNGMWIDNSFGEINGVEHRIHTTGGPLRQQPYRTGPRMREEERKEVERMLSMKVIEPSTSEWAAPVVLVPKPDGSMRFCIDYRKLNSITERDMYPLPRMDDCLDSLGDACVFSTLDANAGYWQIRVSKEDREKTSFICHAGTYQFIRMPFGLVNAPATFQRAMDVILSSVKWKFCLVYLDDIIIYSPSHQQHLKDLDLVLGLLSRAGATLKLKKCHFFKERVKYLGHVILPGKLQIDQSKTVSVRNAIFPRTRTELRSFLGLCNVYRRFIPQFAKIASPLTKMLRGDLREPYNRTEDQEMSFEKLK